MPRVVYVGGRILLPGFNRITDEEHSRLLKAGYWAGLEDQVLTEELSFDENEKPTVQKVKKTYCEALLRFWLEDAKPNIKTAITEQLKLLDVTPKEK